MTGVQPVYCPIVQDSFHHGLDPCGVSSMLLCSDGYTVAVFIEEAICKLVLKRTTCTLIALRWVTPGSMVFSSSEPLHQ